MHSNKTIQQKARECLALVGIPRHLAHTANINKDAVLCHDPEEKPYYHRHINGVTWSIGNGDDMRSGCITGMGRVTEYVGGSQKILPFGGCINSEMETLYRSIRWGIDAIG